jgi:hypothetical protein
MKKIKKISTEMKNKTFKKLYIIEYEWQFNLNLMGVDPTQPECISIF